MKPTSEHVSELKAIRRMLWMILAGVLLQVGLGTTPLGEGESGRVIGIVAVYSALIIAVVTGFAMVVALARRKDDASRDLDEQEDGDLKH